MHSAVPPWFHVDFRAGEPGAGMFRTVFDAHRDLWAFERKTHHGPVFGEGNCHAYWSGLLDGTEAQFGTGWFRAYARLGANSMVFGGSEGLLLIRPNRFEPWQFTPAVVSTVPEPGAWLLTGLGLAGLGLARRRARSQARSR